MVTSRLVLLSCPIRTLMPSLNHIDTSNTATRQPKKAFLDFSWLPSNRSNRHNAAHVLFLWLKLRSPEWPFLPRCLLNSLRAFNAVAFLKVLYFSVRLLRPKSGKISLVSPSSAAARHSDRWRQVAPVSTASSVPFTYLVSFSALPTLSRAFSLSASISPRSRPSFFSASFCRRMSILSMRLARSVLQTRET